MAIRMFILAACLASMAVAQTTKPTDPYQQAYQRMLQRQAARASAATQPAKISQTDLDAILAKLRSLEAEVLQLKQENAKLRAAMPATALKAAGAGLDKSLLSKIKKGMSFDEVNKAIGYAPKTVSTNADGVKTCIWVRIDYQPSESSSPRERDFLLNSARANPAEVLTVEFKDNRVDDFQDDARG